MAGGAPLGNQNAAKKDQLARLLQIALEKDDRRRLLAGIEKVAELFATGDQWAVDFTFNRIDGRLKQAIVVESGASAEERLSTLTALIAEATGQQTDGGDAGFSVSRSVVPAEIPPTAH